MTQIAFTRKLLERGMEIDGTGSRATVKGLKVISRMTPTDMNWQTMTSIARF
jgi:hypothetical protein